MSSIKKLAKVLSFVFIAALVIIAFISSGPPRESKIVSDFSARRTVYELARTMLAEDKGVNTVATWGIETTNSPISAIPAEGGMSVERYQKYLALLKEIGASGVSRGDGAHEVRFLIWASGFGGDTRHVTVSWVEREPATMVKSLEAFYQTEKPRNPSYVHIDGNWYIWADW